MKKLILLMLGVLGWVCGASAQLLVNGDFESWGTTFPTSWGGTGSPVQGPGIVSGSTYSLVVPVGASVGQTIPLASRPVAFQLDFVLAVTDPGSASSRSFNLNLSSPASASAPVLNLRAVQGSTAGVLTLQAYNGSGWVSVVADAFTASVYNSGSNSFTSLSAYNISLNVDFGASPAWSISYGLVGSSMTTVSGLTSFQTAPGGQALSTITFAGTNSASSYAVDNVSITAVPEPSTAFLFVGGVAITVLLRRRFMGYAGG